MAFGGLAGITPGEFLRRFGATPATGLPITGGAGELPYASQLGSLMGGPALPDWRRWLDPLGAANSQGIDMRTLIGSGGGRNPFVPGPNFAGSLPGPSGLPTRVPGRFAPDFGPAQAADVFQQNPSAIGSAPRWLDFSLGRQGVPPAGSNLPMVGSTPPIPAPLAPSGAQVVAAQGRQAEALARQAQAAAGSAGASPIPLGPAAAPAGVTTIPGEVPPRFWLRQLRGEGGRMLPRVPAPSMTGPAATYPAGAQFPLGMRPNVGSIPMGAGTNYGLAPDAVPMSAMAQPRPPGAGMSEVPVSIRGAAAPSAASTLAAEVAPVAGTATTAAAGLRSLPGAIRGAAGAARAGGVRGALATLGEGSGLTGGGLRGAAGTLGRRAIPSLLAYQGLHALSGALGGDDSILGQAAEGAAVAGGIGGMFGLPAGLVAGGVGAIANPITDRLTGGRSFTESLSNLLSGGQDPTEQAIRDQYAGIEGGEQQADAVISRMQAINEGGANRWEGVPSAIKDQLVEEYNTAAANIDGSTEEGQAALRDLLFRTAQAAEMAKAGELTVPERQTNQGNTALTPADLAATQALASQFMAPVAADSAAIGQMGQAALQNLAGPMRGPQGDALRNLADIYGQSGNNMANAYMQQAYVDPQIAVLNQQLALRDQIANQLTSQVISQLPQFATGGAGSSFDDLIAAQAMGGGSGDPAAAMAAAIAGG